MKSMWQNTITGGKERAMGMKPVTIQIRCRYKDALALSILLGKTGYPFDGGTDGKTTTYNIYVGYESKRTTKKTRKNAAR